MKRIGIICANLTDGKASRRALPSAAKVSLIPVRSPAVARGMVLDDLFITPDAARSPNLKRALDVSEQCLLDGRVR